MLFQNINNRNLYDGGIKMSVNVSKSIFLTAGIDFVLIFSVQINSDAGGNQNIVNIGNIL